MLRSLLFVPADRPERFAKAAGSGADAIILDLEDSVALSNKELAREAVATFLAQPCEIVRFVRINPSDGPLVEADLACLEGADGIVLPKASGAVTVRALVSRLQDPLPILPIATETPAAIFELGTYQQVAPHLVGITWGAEDLPASIGALSSRNADGSYTPPFELARSLTLFAAHAAGVEAIETVYPAIRDEAGLRAYAARGAGDGFTGMMALHPMQVPIINAAFTPTEDQLREAERVIAAFAASPDAGVLTLDGRMIDAPHLAQARKLLSRVTI